MYQGLSQRTTEFGAPRASTRCPNLLFWRGMWCYPNGSCAHSDPSSFPAVFFLLIPLESFYLSNTESLNLDSLGSQGWILLYKAAVMGMEVGILCPVHFRELSQHPWSIFTRCQYWSLLIPSCDNQRCLQTLPDVQKEGPNCPSGELIV